MDGEVTCDDLHMRGGEKSNFAIEFSSPCSIFTLFDNGDHIPHLKADFQVVLLEVFLGGFRHRNCALVDVRGLWGQPVMTLSIKVGRT